MVTIKTVETVEELRQKIKNAIENGYKLHNSQLRDFLAGNCNSIVLVNKYNEDDFISIYYEGE